jgi:predicted O-linked N-acetylglucosamine transferase (SPINDLY family)
MSVVLSVETVNECWQAGVEQLLAGQPEEAQVTWLLPFIDDEVQVDEDRLGQSLIDYLLGAIDLQLSQQELHNAYEISKHLCLLVPDNANALFKLLNISIQLEEFELATLNDPTFMNIVYQASSTDINPDLIYIFIQKVADLLTEQFVEVYINFLKLWVGKVADTYRLVIVISSQAFYLGQRLNCSWLQTQMLEICLEYAPGELRFTILCNLVASTSQEKNYKKAILIGEECEKIGENIGEAEHACGVHRLLSALMEAGEWERIPETGKHYLEIMRTFVSNCQQPIKDTSIAGAPYFLNYLYDDPRSLLGLRNAIGDLCSQSVKLEPQRKALNSNYQSLPKTGVLRIGYIASTLGKHSVGWLSRWLFKHHDQSAFQVFIYHVGRTDNNSFNRQFFKDNIYVAHYLGTDDAEIADLIQRDEIDILVDLDSLSMSTTYKVMCRKPAPIAVTWLGWDTSGCPEIDYFIADPYVLPPDAEEYYRTKIWRLPQTYIAIDGFEVEVPTKRRSDYQISENSIVYLCAQKSYKHHPDILRLQMQIIKQVPNSYLLVQPRACLTTVMASYQKLALEVGIEMDRLRFIEPDANEMTHRANLHLADVVLDTFPYNGATTTLETLWMAVPIVTRVGEGFVSRNSYAFMQQVGVTEGIAHTDAEYVDWGVRLGTDLALRQQVMGKLLHSRKTSPLWNARSFTLEMENAYRQMWEIYQSQVLAQQK